MKTSLVIKRWMFPGINLHSRLRYRRLPRHFGDCETGRALNVLDAGSGNGMLAFQSYRKGNRVVGVSFKPAEVRGSQELFNQYLGVPEDKLRFIEGNLYELDFPEGCFDEIICSEVLEHLLDDKRVCRSFWRLLKPGGVLHVCAPNAEHPYNASFPLDENESGGHVRSGYTVETYRELLDTIGFSIVDIEGLGGALRQWFNGRIKTLQSRFGAWAGVPLFLVAVVLLPLERRESEKRCPYSIYIKAVKSR